MASPLIIQIGLPWNYHGFPPQFQEEVRDKLELGRKVMADAGYSNFETVDVSPELGIDAYIAYLQSHSVDGVCVGYGIRASKELTPFMELLIDATRTHAPKSKIIFNTSPDSTAAAADRWFAPTKPPTS